MRFREKLYAKFIYSDSHCPNIYGCKNVMKINVLLDLF